MRRILCGLCAAIAAISAEPNEGKSPAPPTKNERLAVRRDVLAGPHLDAALERLRKANPELLLQTLDGKRLTWESVRSLSSAGVRVVDSDGARFIDFRLMSEGVRKAVGYDETLAKLRLELEKETDEFIDTTSALVKEVEFNEAEEKARLEKYRARLVARQRFAEAKVHFTTKAGAAVWPRWAISLTSPTKTTLGSEGPPSNEWRLERKEDDERIFVYGMRGVADGEIHRVRLIPCGTYRYTAVSGATLTLRAYATTVEEAIQVLDEEAGAGRKD